MTSRRVNPLRDVGAARHDVTERVSQEIFDKLRSPLFRELSTCKLILDIEHPAGRVPTLPGPEIKPTSRKNEHGYS